VLASRLLGDGLAPVARKIEAGEPLEVEDGVRLFEEADLGRLGVLANLVKQRLHGDRVFYRNDLNLNHTNVCAISCALCVFGVSKNAPNAYTMDLEFIESKARAAVEQGVNEFHIVGGLNPECDLAYFEEMFRRLSRLSPRPFLQALTAVEIDYLARIERIEVDDVLRRLLAAGLGSIPGGGAEIFDPEVRRKICRPKITGERWLEVHRIAHGMGVKSNATMLYGHVEDSGARVRHMAAIRELQDETGGFQAFIPLSFNPEETQLAKRYEEARDGSTGTDDLRTAAVSRLFLGNVPHTKLVWQTVGKRVAQVSLGYGVDDVGGSSFEERIVHAAGANSHEFVRLPWLPELIRDAGQEPVEMNSAYEAVEMNALEDRRAPGPRGA
jgi:aminodeoxyfutalosine synthase